MGQGVQVVRGQGVKGQTMAIRTVPVLAMSARAVDGAVKNGGGGSQEWWRGKSRMVEGEIKNGGTCGGERREIQLSKRALP